MTDSLQQVRPAAEPDSLRAELRRWLDDNWDPGLSLLDWRERLCDAGWAVPAWPRRWYGLDLPSWAADLVSREIAAYGAVGTPLGGGMGLAGPTILERGPDAARERFLRPILTGAETWCQLFSEPGAGSDLAGLTTRAELDGDEWVVNGQKVWNTSAHHADFGLLVARTDWSAPKHRGLTYFALPMHQPGVEVRPLHQMNGHSSFNEVFLTDARIPKDMVIGDVGAGWQVAMTTLAYERRFGGMSRPRYARDGGRALEEASAEADEHFATYRWYPQRAGRADLIIDRLEAGTIDDPLARQQAAGVLSLQQASRWTAERATAARALGRPPGSEGSIGKLALSEVARRSALAHTSLVGAHGMLNGPDSPDDGTVPEILVSTPAQSIAGGTDEIQHNIIGEKVLGLPRDPSVDRDIPFRDVLRN
ncbi:MAG: acyl-CoA dehydrogenase family protein [Actinomycetota bacterium]|nr:acyl-CoA dehydrogenase family protein [Actinomycetota bacterium]